MGELGVQQGRLRKQAELLQEQAAASRSPAESKALQAQAESLRREAREFWKPAPAFLLAAGGLYALGMLAPCLYWRRCLKQLDQADHLLDICWAYYYGNLGKYLPGKAMVIVLRVGALAEHQVKKTATVLTIFMETLTLMSVGGAVAAVCLIILQIDWRLTLLAVGLLLSTLAPASPPVMRFLLPKLQKGVDPQQLSQWTSRLSWRLFFQGWLLLTLGWLLNGLSLMLILKGLPSAELQGTDGFTLLISACGACALAVVLGFVSLVPGGAGVREFVILAVLTPVVGPTAALCSAVWLRIVWLCTELVMVGLLAFMRWSLSGVKAPGATVSQPHSNQL
jgi:uncharacterized membrane protein YbhN (UPF0104 family)